MFHVKQYFLETHFFSIRHFENVSRETFFETFFRSAFRFFSFFAARKNFSQIRTNLQFTDFLWEMQQKITFSLIFPPKFPQERQKNRQSSQIFPQKSHVRSGLLSVCRLRGTIAALSESATAAHDERHRAESPCEARFWLHCRFISTHGEKSPFSAIFLRAFQKQPLRWKRRS